MDVYTLGLNGPEDMLDRFRSCIWNMQYYGFGDFELIAAATEKNRNLLKIGTMLARSADVGNETIKNIMVIQEIEIRTNTESGDTITARGKGLKYDLLRKRVVWEQTNTDGTVEDAIRKVITDNLISPNDADRAISNTVLAERNGWEETANIQLFGENIAEWVQEICQSYNYGWDVEVGNGKYIFRLYEGNDHTYSSGKPVIFSREYDNLLETAYSKMTEKYANTALIGGEGNGISQRTASIGDSTGQDRYETYIDGSSVSSNGEIITEQTYLSMLQEYGKTQLANAQEIDKISATVDYKKPFEIGKDFDLGDTVQIVTEEVEAIARVLEVIYSEAPEGITVIPTFSEWEQMG